MAVCDVAQSCRVSWGFPPRRRPWPRLTRRRTGSGWRATPSAGRSHGTATRRWSRRGATAARATLGPRGGGAQDPPLPSSWIVAPPPRSMPSNLSWWRCHQQRRIYALSRIPGIKAQECDAEWMHDCMFSEPCFWGTRKSAPRVRSRPSLLHHLHPSIGVRPPCPVPPIDAAMQQLQQIGWMHHLARHCVACFLTRGDLWQHWEEGARVFGRGARLRAKGNVAHGRYHRWGIPLPLLVGTIMWPTNPPCPL